MQLRCSPEIRVTAVVDHVRRVLHHEFFSRLRRICDKELHAGNGYVMLAIGLALIAVSCWLAYTGFDVSGHSPVRTWIALAAIIVVMSATIISAQPAARLSEWEALQQ
jgi:hypothetical protein